MLEGHQGPPVFPGDSGPGLTARGVYQLSRATRSWVRGSTGLIAVPGDSGPCLKARRVDQLFLWTRVWVRGSAGSTICPVSLGLVSEGPRGRPDLQCESGKCPMPRGVNQRSGATPA